MFELMLDAVLQRAVPVAKPVAKFTPVERDLAVIVKDVITHAQLMAAVQSAQTQGLLRQAVLFDVYRPKNETPAMAMDEKSLAVRLTLNSDDATLTEPQIEAVVQSVLAQLTAQLGARLRA
jgi:phenylalanyl-tRNA synthetase beta chain